MVDAVADRVAPLVVKATTPVAADYGEASIPTDAVWIQKP